MYRSEANLVSLKCISHCFIISIVGPPSNLERMSYDYIIVQERKETEGALRCQSTQHPRFTWGCGVGVVPGKVVRKGWFSVACTGSCGIFCIVTTTTFEFLYTICHTKLLDIAIWSSKSNLTSSKSKSSYTYHTGFLNTSPRSSGCNMCSYFHEMKDFSYSLQSGQNRDSIVTDWC